MRRVMVRYRVKPEHVAENERLVRDVYEELRRDDPDGFHYATFRLADGVTFVHVAIEEEGGEPVLPALGAFQRFREGLGERCAEAPVATELSEVGAFRLFSGG
jgi:hypothetical protein